ncbi:MipA/OmpV family protein [Pseudoalteromonas sp. GB56]
MLRLWLTLTVLLSNATIASESRTDEIPTGQWLIGVNLGYGVMSNPLNGGDDLNLYVVPDIAYYTDTWYLDNTQVGYTFINESEHVVSAIAEFNPHTRFFVDWHPANLFALQSSMVLPAETEGPKAIYIDEIKERRWALDSGMEYHYFSPIGKFSMKFVADITDVYRGFRGEVAWSQGYRFENWVFEPSVGVQYSNNELNTYFYGLSDDEVGNFSAVSLGSSVHPYARIDASYILTERSALRMHINYIDFSTLSSDSPLFDESYSVTAFVGVKYIF